MGIIRFRVKRPLFWDGKDYQRGDIIEIPEGHPHLNIDNWRRHTLEYESGPSASSGVEERPEIREPTTRRRR